MNKLLFSTLLTVTALTAAPTVAVTRYTVTEISPFGPLDINNLGQMAGQTSNAKAGIWSDGAVTLIDLPNSSGEAAFGINDLGDAVGSWDENAFLWHAGTLTDLGTLFSCRSANGINNLNQIIGTGRDGNGLLISGTNCTQLPKMPGSTTFTNPTDINNVGQIVGWVSTYYYYAVLIEGDTLLRLPVLPGDNKSQAYAINDAGQVVGYCGLDNYSSRAFLYSGGTTTALGTLPGTNRSIATDINNNGLVVGLSYADRTDFRRAVLFADGQVRDLNNLIPPDSGWTLSQAKLINDLGQIVCWDTVHRRNLLLTPFETLPGDTSPFDGVIDLQDLNNVLDHFGATSPSVGDTAPFDARVDLADLNNVLNHLGPADRTAALSLVPEPSSLAYVFAAALPLLRHRKEPS